MEENEAPKGGGFRDGVGAPMEQLPEDGDYDDLYNDVNVGENFLESFRKNKEEKAVGASVQAAGGEVKVEKGKNVISAIWSGDRSSDLAGRGNEMGDRDLVPATRLESSGDGGVKVGSHCHPSGKMVDLEKNASKNVVSQEMIRRPTAASAGVSGNAGNVGNSGNDNMVRQGMVSGYAMGSIGSLGASGAGPSGGEGGGGTILFVSDLHWWTTDAQLEAESSKYGAVKEITFFSEPCTGKSKGYCKVEFYEPDAAAACKEGMNGHVFNGRACVVGFASTSALKKLGKTLVSRNKRNAQGQTAPVNERARWGPGDTAGKPGGNNNNATVSYSQGGGDNNRGLGRANWGGADSQGMGNKGPVGPMRNRTGGVVGRGFMGNAGGGFGQVISAASPLIRPQAMMDQGFDPAFGGPMGRMGGHGGFPGGPTPPFSSILPSFQPAGEVDLHGVGPLVNPTFFGRGIPASAMGIMAHAGLEGPSMGMWSDPNMGGRSGDEHGYRAGESNYGAEPTYFRTRMPASAMGIMAHAGLEGPNMGMWSDPNMGGRAGDEHGYRAGESNYGAEPTYYGRRMSASSMGIMARAGLEGPNMGMWSDPNMGERAGDEHGYRAGDSSYGAEPTHFGRGMPPSPMGIMARAGLEGPNMGMWSDPNMGRRAGDEHGYRAGESNYEAEPVSDHQYGEERLSNKEKDRGSERYTSRSSDKRHIDNREPSPDRDIARDKNTGRDHDCHGRRRQGDRDVGQERERGRPRSRDHDHDLERHRDSEHKHGRPRDHRERYADRRRYKGRSSRTQAKSRLSHEDKSRSRSKDADNEKTSDY